jgi:hypothetical protein
MASGFEMNPGWEDEINRGATEDVRQDLRPRREATCGTGQGCAPACVKDPNRLTRMSSDWGSNGSSPASAIEGTDTNAPARNSS